MKRLLVLAPLVLASTPVAAHPTDIPYESLGECEAAFAQFSRLDRERLAAMGFTRGEAQRTFREMFACTYDPNSDLWFIVRLRGM